MCTERQDATESDQIEYGQILNLIEKRFNSLWSIQKPNITLIAHPVLPESQLILVGEIYEYLRDRAGSSRFSKQPFEFFEPQDNEEPWGTREVPGGVRLALERRKLFYQELNVNGIVYYRDELPKHTLPGDESKCYLLLEDLTKKSCEILAAAADFYERCWKYTGNIIVTERLRHLGNERLASNEFKTFAGLEFDLMPQRQSLDSEIFASINCCASDLKVKEKTGKRSLELVARLLQGFNVDVNNPTRWRYTVCEWIDRWHKGL